LKQFFFIFNLQGTIFKVFYGFLFFLNF